LAVRNYRLQRTSETVIRFHEAPANQPQALKAWFYGGDNYGLQFVYPKQEAVQLAASENEAVPAELAEPTQDTLKTAPLAAETPSGKEEPLNCEFPAKPPSK
jgi:hypothetical protein